MFGVCVCIGPFFLRQSISLSSLDVLEHWRCVGDCSVFDVIVEGTENLIVDGVEVYRRHKGQVRKSFFPLRPWTLHGTATALRLLLCVCRLLQLSTSRMFKYWSVFSMVDPEVFLYVQSPLEARKNTLYSQRYVDTWSSHPYVSLLQNVPTKSEAHNCIGCDCMQ